MGEDKINIFLRAFLFIRRLFCYINWHHYFGVGADGQDGEFGEAMVCMYCGKYKFEGNGYYYYDDLVIELMIRLKILPEGFELDEKI